MAKEYFLRHTILECYNEGVFKLKTIQLKTFNTKGTIMRLAMSILTIICFVFITSTMYAADKSLVLHLSFDEGSGDTVKDHSSYGNDAKVKGAKWGEGKFGGGMKFGAKAFCEIDDSDSLDLTTAMTISMWTKVSKGGGTQSGIEKQPAWQPGEYNLCPEYGGGVLLQAADWPAACADTAVTPTNVLDEKWHSIAGTWDGNVIKVYIDGEVKKELACVGKIKVGNGKAYVGSRGGTARWVLGSLDEIKVYNRALSATEISKDMENPTAVSPAGKLTTSWADVRSNL